MVTNHIEIPRCTIPGAVSPVTNHTTPVNNDIKGLIDSANDGSTSAFMWEWFTTKPWLDSGEVRFVCTLHRENIPACILKFTWQIGSVPTPWPSWLIAAHPSPERAPKEAVRVFLNTLTNYVTKFDSQERRTSTNIPFIQKTWGYPEADIKVRRPAAECVDCIA